MSDIVDFIKKTKGWFSDYSYGENRNENFLFNKYNIDSVQFLFLYDNQLLEIPDCINELAELKSLSINSMFLHKMPRNINLPNLSNLIINDCSLQELPSFNRELNTSLPYSVSRNFPDFGYRDKLVNNDSYLFNKGLISASRGQPDMNEYTVKKVILSKNNIPNYINACLKGGFKPTIEQALDILRIIDSGVDYSANELNTNAIINKSGFKNPELISDFCSLISGALLPNLDFKIKNTPINDARFNLLNSVANSLKVELSTGFSIQL